MAQHASRSSSYVGAFLWYAVLIFFVMNWRSSDVIWLDQSDGHLLHYSKWGLCDGWCNRCDHFTHLESSELIGWTLTDSVNLLGEMVSIVSDRPLQQGVSSATDAAWASAMRLMTLLVNKMRRVDDVIAHSSWEVRASMPDGLESIYTHHTSSFRGKSLGESEKCPEISLKKKSATISLGTWVSFALTG